MEERFIGYKKTKLPTFDCKSVTFEDFRNILQNRFKAFTV